MTDIVTKERTITAGTGTYTMDGVAMTGFRTFAEAVTSGDITDGGTVSCLVTNGVQRELVSGIYAAGPKTLSRVSILASTNAGAAVSWGAGPKEISFRQPTPGIGDLTGPITSSGNVTSVASQTGTGSTFAMSSGPTFTGTVSSARFTSTVANGVAPFVVTSLTRVINLNAATAGTADNLAGGLGGQIPYQSAAATTAMLANGTAGQFLRSNGTTLAPSWVTAGAGDALTTNPLSQFAATTSAQLLGVISDETGSGALVFATSPALVTPALGVATATSIWVGATAPVSNSILNAVTPGNSIEFGHSNSAGYRSTIGAENNTGRPFVAFNAEAGTSNDTYRTRGIKGSVIQSDLAGGFKFGTVATATADNQSLTTLGTWTPTGFAVSGPLTATAINGNTITTGTGVLTLAASKTLTVSNTLTLTATDGSTLAVGTGGTLGTAAYTAASEYQNSTRQWAGTAGGTANALTLTLTPAITAYVAGQAFRFKSASTNTAAATVAVSGLATKAVQVNGAALIGGEIVASQWYEAVYDGAAFQLKNITTFLQFGTGAVARSPQSRLRESVSVADFGVVGDGTDETIKIQAALDSRATLDAGFTLLFPWTAAGYGITAILLKNSNVIVEGIGGMARLLFVGTAASAATMVSADKSVDHGSQNYKNLVLKNIEIDGAGKALIGFYGNGFTRRCKLDGVDIHGCVNPLKVSDGYYSNYKNVELRETPQALPAGMAQGTFDANKFGAVFNVCHAMTFENFILYNIGGDSSNPYTAALRMTSCEGVKFNGYTFEAMQQAANGRYLTRILDIQGSVSAHFDSGYWEQLQSSSEMMRSYDNAVLGFSNTYMNDIKTTALLQAEEMTPVSFDTIFAENLDISDRLFKVTTGTGFRSLSFNGACTFAAGPQSGVTYVGNTTTNSKQGIPCDPILLANDRSSVGTGYVKRGYSLAIVGSDIQVQPGEAVVNGQAVQFIRHSALSQLLRPDLSVADTWNLKITGAGNPYTERQSALKAGSAYALTIGTFTTPGASGVPANLTSIDIPLTRLSGKVLRPLTAAVLVNEAIGGSLTLADTGTAADSNLMTLTIPTAGPDDDDGLGVIIDYIALSTGGDSATTEMGRVKIAFTQNDSDVCVSAVVKDTPAQALSSSMTTFVTTFSVSITSNVATVKMKSETSANVSTLVLFEAHIMGSRRTGAAAALASGVTRAI